MAGKQAFYYRLPVLSIKSRGWWPDLSTMVKEDVPPSLWASLQPLSPLSMVLQSNGNFY
jgi:hypothetical protein